jgi:hypothetical protein
MPEVIDTDATPTMSQRSLACAKHPLKKKRTHRNKLLAET